MTLHEYLATPESVLPQDLIFGTLRVAEAPLVPHQRTVLRLAVALRSLVLRHQLGEVLIAPTDVILDAERALVVQPDLLFVSSTRADIVRDRVYGAPDLVVEVLSPHPRIGQLDERVGWFAQYGVREIWLYSQPDRTMHVLACANGHVISDEAFTWDRVVQSAVLPDIEWPLGSMV
jgi:Uma2 family endonuclease